MTTTKTDSDSVPVQGQPAWGHGGSGGPAQEEDQAYLASFPECNPYPVVAVDLEGRVRYANPAVRRLFPDLVERGTAHPWLGDWAEVVRPFRAGRSCLVVREVRVGERRFEQTLHYIEEQDTVRIYGLDCTARRQAEDALRTLNAALENRIRERTAELTEANRALEAEAEVRQATEAKVQAERQRLHEVLEALPAYVILLSADHHVPFANRVFRERFGEPQGRRCFEFLFGRNEPCTNCESYRPLESGTPHRWAWSGPDGRDYEIRDIRFAGADGAPAILEMGIDVTERRRAEVALRELNQTLERRVAERTAALAETSERFRSLAEGMPHIVWLCDAQGQCIYQNHVWSDYVGRVPGSTLGETWLDVVHPEDRGRMLAEWRRYVEAGGRHGITLEARLRRHDGSYRWFRSAGSPIRDASGALVHWAGTAMDIDDERRIGTQLRQHMEELQAANDDLTRFNRVAVDRELRMVELKKEVNDLRAQLGLPARYAVQPTTGDAGHA
jgi:PAS domain S-box-containing protein